MRNSEKKKAKEYELGKHIQYLIDNKDILGISSLLVKEVNKMKRSVDYSKRLIEVISNAKIEDDHEINTQISKPFKVIFRKTEILTYEKQKEETEWVNGKPVFKFTKEYEEYKKEIEEQLEKQIDDILDFLPTKKEEYNKIKMKIAFYVNYTQKDLDNIMKPFIDVFFRYISNNDRKLYDDSQLFSIEVVKRPTSNTGFRHEFIAFDFQRITDNRLNENDLIHKFNDFTDFD